MGDIQTKNGSTESSVLPFFYNLGKSALRSLFVRLGGFLRLNQAVSTVFAGVDDAQGIVALPAEHEEAVVEQIHLQDRLLSAHGLDGEMLLAHDLELTLLADLRLGGQGGGIESALAQTLLQTGLDRKRNV